jgi:hypothetical protein
MRFSSVLAFRAPAQRSGGVRKCRGCARGPTTTAASGATLISRGCSPGASVVASLAAAVAPVRTSQASAGVRAVRRGGRVSARDVGSEERLAHCRMRRMTPVKTNKPAVE